MTKTFTPVLNFPEKKTDKEPKTDLAETAEPSASTIRNILNFSKNLEVKNSELVRYIEVRKS